MDTAMYRQHAEPTTKSNVEKYIAPDQLQLNVAPKCEPYLLRPMYSTLI
jgi:hypothetical protein